MCVHWLRTGVYWLCWFLCVRMCFVCVYRLCVIVFAGFEFVLVCIRCLA